MYVSISAVGLTLVFLTQPRLVEWNVDTWFNSLGVEGISLILGHENLNWIIGHGRSLEKKGDIFNFSSTLSVHLYEIGTCSSPTHYELGIVSSYTVRYLFLLQMFPQVNKFLNNQEDESQLEQFPEMRPLVGVSLCLKNLNHLTRGPSLAAALQVERRVPR